MKEFPPSMTGDDLLKTVPDPHENSVMEHIIIKELGFGALSAFDFALTPGELAAIDHEFQLCFVGTCD